MCSCSERREAIVRAASAVVRRDVVSARDAIAFVARSARDDVADAMRRLVKARTRLGR